MVVEQPYELAERRAQMARAEADRQRADAELHNQRAAMHERGMADDELVADHERERFAPAMNDESTTTERAVDGGTAHEPAAPAAPRGEYEQGRVDERAGRFDREGADAPTEPRRP